MGTHEVGKGESCGRGPGKNRTALVEIRDTLAGEIVIGQKPAAVRLAGQGFLKEFGEELAPVHVKAHEMGKFAEEIHPGVDVGGAVVAVNHRDRKSVRRGHHVDLAVDAQRVIRDDHGEVRGPGGDVARPDPDRVGGGHAGAGIALAGSNRDAGEQGPVRIQKTGSCLGKHAAAGSRGQHLRKNRAQIEPGEIQKLPQHAGVIVTGLAVNREHAGSFAHTHHLLARELPVNVACQRREIGDVLHMFLSVQHGLIQVGDAPALRNVEAEERGQLLCRFSGDGVAPGAEFRQLLSVLVKGEIAVHHGGDADGADGREVEAEFVLQIVLQRFDTGPEPGVDAFHGIGPDAVDEPVFPFIVAGGDGTVLLIDQDGFDAGRAKLNPEYGFGQIHRC